MLIDEFMPRFDFAETHETTIDAPADSVFAAIRTFDACESAIIRWLFRMRGLPTENMTLQGFERMGFKILQENENEEILVGLAGRFWTPWGDMQKVNAETFREFAKEGYAKAAFNFSLAKTGKVKTLLKTETRIRTFDETSRSRFGLYWTFIAPFSGWTRREMLRIIKEDAESVESAEQMT